MASQLKAGDLVLMKFHASYKAELRKYRPAVILNADPEITNQRFVTILPFSTENKVYNELELELTHPAFDKLSVLLCWYISTYDVERVMQKIGELTPSQLKKVKQTVQKLC